MYRTIKGKIIATDTATGVDFNNKYFLSDELADSFTARRFFEIDPEFLIKFYGGQKNLLKQLKNIIDSIQEIEYTIIDKDDGNSNGTK